MPTYNITTNHHKREIVDAWSLPIEARKEFDYLDWSAIENGTDSASFVQYKGEWYDLGDVMQTESGGDFATLGWDGFNSHSYWSGMLFKWVTEDYDEYAVIGYVYVSD